MTFLIASNKASALKDRGLIALLRLNSLPKVDEVLWNSVSHS